MRVSHTLMTKILHIVTVLLLIGAFGLAFVQDEMPLSPTKLKYINYHKWFGITVLGVSILRWINVFLRPKIAPFAQPPLQTKIAQITHWALYALLLAVPMLGWLMSSAKGFTTVYLGISALALPNLIAKNPEFAKTLAEMHEISAYTLLALIGLHSAAAIYHHVVLRDGLTARMFGLGK